MKIFRKKRRKAGIDIPENRGGEGEDSLSAESVSSEVAVKGKAKPYSCWGETAHLAERRESGVKGAKLKNWTIPIQSSPQTTHSLGMGFFPSSRHAL